MAIENISKNGDQITRRTFVGAGVAGATTWSLAGAQSINSSDFGSISPKEALSMAENRRTELVDLLTRLISIRSQSGETAELAQDVVKDFLAPLPYRVEVFADNPSRFTEHAEFMPPDPPGDGPFVNVVAKPHGGPGARLAIFAHIDSHIVEDGWKTDPYQVAIDNGKLYGLGSADDKGGVAAMLVAAAALAEAGGPTPIVISSHGKGGGSRGSLPVFSG